MKKIRLSFLTWNFFKLIVMILASSILVSIIPMSVSANSTLVKGEGNILARLLDTGDSSFVEYTFHGTSLADFIALCAVDGYLTNKDDDIAWKCTFNEVADNSVSQKGIKFRLEKFYDGGGGGRIRAKAVLLPRDEFILFYDAAFTLSDSSLEYLDSNGSHQVLPPGEQGLCVRNQFPANSQIIPITTILLYEGGDSKDFGFDTRYDAGNHCFYMKLQRTTWNSVIEGHYLLIQNKSIGSGSLGSVIDEVGNIVYGNGSKNIGFQYHHPTWDPNVSDSFVFNTLFRYMPEGDDDYAGWVWGNKYDENRINEGISTTIITDFGDPASSIGFQTILLQETW